MEKFPEAKAVRVIQDNAEAQERFNKMNLTPKEFIKLDLGYITLDAYMIKPKDFDPNKKYPVIIDVYGEPAGSTVQDNWTGGDIAAHNQADKGYIMSASRTAAPTYPVAASGASVSTSR